MKIKSIQFKNFIKESIKELIEEGSFNDLFKEILTESMQKRGLVGKNIVAENSEDSGLIKNNHLERIAEITAANTFTGNNDRQTKKMYEEILIDTAKTTLQKQLSNEGTRNSNLLTGEVSVEQTRQDVQELQSFGPVVNRWAAVAFAKKK